MWSSCVAVTDDKIQILKNVSTADHNESNFHMKAIMLVKLNCSHSRNKKKKSIKLPPFPSLLSLSLLKGEPRKINNPLCYSLQIIRHEPRTGDHLFWASGTIITAVGSLVRASEFRVVRANIIILWWFLYGAAPEIELSVELITYLIQYARIWQQIAELKIMNLLLCATSGEGKAPN